MKKKDNKKLINQLVRLMLEETIHNVKDGFWEDTFLDFADHYDLNESLQKEFLKTLRKMKQKGV